jgi:hypothetical protein
MFAHRVERKGCGGGGLTGMVGSGPLGFWPRPSVHQEDGGGLTCGVAQGSSPLSGASFPASLNAIFTFTFEMGEGANHINRR